MAARRKKELATYMEGATGAGDANSGGGAGAGIPDGETALRTGDKITSGDVERDKAKLFPDRFGGAGNRRGGGTKSKPASRTANPGQGVRQAGAKRPAAGKSARKGEARTTAKAKSPAARGSARRGKQRS